MGPYLARSTILQPPITTTKCFQIQSQWGLPCPYMWLISQEEPDLRFYPLTKSLVFLKLPRATSLAVWLEAVWDIKEAVSGTRAATHEVYLEQTTDLFIKISESSVFKLTAVNRPSIQDVFDDLIRRYMWKYFKTYKIQKSVQHS